MPVPIADDWKAINDRKQQIEAERSAFSKPCRMCNNLVSVREVIESLESVSK